MILLENFDHILDAPVREHAQVRYAGFWVRATACVIDWMIMFVPMIVLLIIIPGQLTFLFLIGGPLLYGSLMECSRHKGTLGKMAVGICVIGEHQTQISFGRSLARNASQWISFVILLIGFMMTGWDVRCQSLHDKIAGTYVIFLTDSANG